MPVPTQDMVCRPGGPTLETMGSRPYLGRDFRARQARWRSALDLRLCTLPVPLQHGHTRPVTDGVTVTGSVTAGVTAGALRNVLALRFVTVAALLPVTAA